MREYYVFTVEAINDIGSSDLAKTTNITLSENDSKSVPSIPLNVQKVKSEKDGKKEWTVTFDKSENDGGYAITYYGAKYGDQVVTETGSPIIVPDTDSPIMVFAQNKVGRSDEVEAVDKTPVDINNATGPAMNVKKTVGKFSMSVSAWIGVSFLGLFFILLILYFLYDRFFKPRFVMQ